MASKSEAYINGWLAQRCDSQEPEIRGNRPQVASKNPYNESTQERSHIDWHNGYYDRQNAIKHGGDLSLDDAWMDL